jgi:preprotein translocase subunit YajC
MQDAIEAGDEIITAGGLHGRVVEDEGETVRIEIASGVVATLDRRAIAAVATEVEVEVEPAAEEDDGVEAVDELQDPAPGSPSKPR